MTEKRLKGLLPYQYSALDDFVLEVVDKWKPEGDSKGYRERDAQKDLTSIKPNPNSLHGSGSGAGGAGARADIRGARWWTPKPTNSNPKSKEEREELHLLLSEHPCEAYYNSLSFAEREELGLKEAP